MAAAMVFLMCWTALIVARQTPIGCFLHRIMIEAPAVAARRISRVQLAIAVVVLLLIVLHATAGDADPIRMLGLFAPDLALWLTSLEISAVLEMAASLAATVTAMRRLDIPNILASVALKLAKRPESKANRTRCSRRRTYVSPANDDEDDAVFALAS